MSNERSVERPDILTCRGQYFNFLCPEESEFGIEEIAHGLSNICRFAGHCNQFYSVAQHSWWVSMLVSPKNALAGLLHDAAEAFIGDVARPLKRLLPDYRAIERRVEAAVLKRFGLAPNLPEEVSRFDLIMLAAEQRDLMPEHHDTWGALIGIEAPSFKVIPVGPQAARWMFLKRYAELTGIQVGT